MLAKKGLKFSYKVYAGGPLSSKVGTELVSAGVPLYPLYGGSEFGPQTNIFDVDDSRSSGPDAKTSADWEWLTFSDRVNLRMVPQGDGTYESQFLVRFTCSISARHSTAMDRLAPLTGLAWKICRTPKDTLLAICGNLIL